MTLSTLPSRIGRLGPTLASLWDQTVPPTQTVLVIPPRSIRERSAYDVPAFLREDPRVLLLESGQDWGPATKLLPTLRAWSDHRDTPILVVDDDLIYPRTFIETYMAWARRLPDSALTLRGCRTAPTRRWKDCRELNGSEVDHPVRVDIAEGCAGILVRPRFFDSGLYDYHPAPPEAFFVDDLWISGHLARRRVPACLIPFGGPFVYLPVLSQIPGRQLHRGENRSGHNNDVMLDYFAKDWGWE